MLGNKKKSKVLSGWLTRCLVIMHQNSSKIVLADENEQRNRHGEEGSSGEGLLGLLLRNHLGDGIKTFSIRIVVIF